MSIYIYLLHQIIAPNCIVDWTGSEKLCKNTGLNNEMQSVDLSRN